MLTTYDYIAIGFFFLFMLALGPIFKRYSEDDSDFFRGGGKMLWWMVGGSAFMCQFSAWTFTGALPAKPTRTVLWSRYCSFANAFGFFVNYLWFAPRFRRMRIVSPIEGVRERFGPVNEQIFHMVADSDEPGLRRHLAQRPGCVCDSRIWVST